jgi:hypothetical protein
MNYSSGNTPPPDSMAASISVPNPRRPITGSHAHRETALAAILDAPDASPNSSPVIAELRARWQHAHGPFGLSRGRASHPRAVAVA